MKNEPFSELVNQAFDIINANGAKKCGAKAIRLFKKASRKGDLRAIEILGNLYQYGHELKKNRKKALKFHRQAASRGSTFSQSHLGIMLYEDGDYQGAFELWRKVEDAGNPFGITAKGIAYEEGKGVDQDFCKAVELYQAAALKKEEEAIIRLAFCYREGRGVEKNIPGLLKLLDIACELENHRAWEMLGGLYNDKEIPSENHWKEAMDCWEKAADLGSADSQAWCGETYSMGNHCDVDVEKGLRYLNEAIKTKNPRAMYIKAYLMATGNGVKRKPRAAFRLCKKAALAGEHDAQCMMGYMLERGNGVRSNLSKAIRWYQKAACGDGWGGEKARKRLEILVKF